MAKKTKKLVLLDSHAIIHRAYHALPDFVSKKGEPTGALYGLTAFLLKIAKELKPDYLIACYDLPGPTHRHDAYKDYKAGRQKIDEELIAQLKSSRDVFRAFNVPLYEKAGFEADDIIGTIAEIAKKNKNLETVIASGDMDTLQLVDGDKVTVYTLKKGINDTIVYDEKAVMERFSFPPKNLTDYKGLAGDKSDNIPGIAGIGDKSATELITNFGTLEEMYKKIKKDKGAFEKVGIKARVVKLLEEGKEEALFSKTLATITRDAPIDFALPKTEWMPSVEKDKLDKLFSELDFRTMRARAQDVFGFEASVDEEDNEAVEEVDEMELKKVGIALWLLNSDLTTQTLEDILEYSPQKRSFATAKETILKEVKVQGLEKVYNEIELPLIPVIKKAEDCGIKVDVPYLKKLSKKHHATLSKYESEIWKMAGGEFNINSPKQLGEVLFDTMKLTAKGLKKTAGGARSTRESELEKLKDSHPIIEKILSYRELQKLLSTYIDTIPTMADEKGRLHTSLNQTGAVTGRMSSTNPNLQNIPSKEGLGMEVRSAFVSEKGSMFVALDYSQIEMRVLAELSGDETLVETFKSGADVHSSVASRVFGVKQEDVTKDMRRKAKVINFGIIYGMGVNALKTNLDSTRAEAQEFYDNYFKTFPKISAYFDGVKANAKKIGYTETYFGRRRYFPGIQSHLPFIRAMAERMAMNAPIQGTGADIVKLAMIACDGELSKRKLDAHLLLQVHDELIFEVKEKDVKEASVLLKKAMEGVAKLTIPLTVDVSVGERWGELKRISIL